MRALLTIVCSLALACAARGQVTSTGSGGRGVSASAAQGESKSNKPKPKKTQTQSSQDAVTAGEPKEKVDPRQIMRQAQHDPSTETKQKMKSESRHEPRKPETTDKMMRMQHYQDDFMAGLKHVGGGSNPREQNQQKGHGSEQTNPSVTGTDSYGTRGGKQKGQGDVMNSFQVIQKEMGKKVSPTPRPR